MTLNQARYIVKRWGILQVIILGFEDFAYMLRDESERERMGLVLRECRPQYSSGEVIEQEGDLE